MSKFTVWFFQSPVSTSVVDSVSSNYPNSQIIVIGDFNCPNIVWVEDPDEQILVSIINLIDFSSEFLIFAGFSTV